MLECIGALSARCSNPPTQFTLAKDYVTPYFSVAVIFQDMRFRIIESGTQRAQKNPPSHDVRHKYIVLSLGAAGFGESPYVT